MVSEQNPAKVRPETGDDKHTAHSKPVSVRFPDWRLEKLVRLAAVERGTTRSELMAEAAVREARVAMQLQREDDFQAWLERQAA